MRTFDPRKNEKGFMLALAIILVVLLTFSGLAFLHANFLERRLGMEEQWNQKAFYLALAGIERARESFKITTDSGGVPNWTPILDPNDPAHPAGYPVDASPDPLLCPDVTKGCVIPPFQTTAGNPGHVTVNGQAITATDMPFSGTGDPGSYSVRAFNNGGTGDSGTTDGDSIITLRALGNVNGKVKVIQVNVLASTKLGIFSCQGNPGEPCPDLISGSPVVDYMEGRGPASAPVIPVPMPLNNPSNYYLQRANFAGITQAVEIPAGDTLSDSAGKNKVKVENNTLYFVDTGTSSSSITIDVNSANNIIIVNKTGSIDFKSGHLTNAVVAATGTVTLNGGSKTSINAPSMLPAIIAGAVRQGASSVEIWGGIYATGEINLNPITVHGVLVGNPIEIQGGTGTTFTDEENYAHYMTMPGITYPDEIKNTSVVLQTWKEVQ